MTAAAAPPTQPSRSPRSRERGVALLVVLLVIALVGLVAIETQYVVRIDGRIASHVAFDTRFHFIAKAGVEASRSLLREDRRDNTSDHLLETWAAPIGYPIEDVLVSLDILDENRKLPLNALLTRPTEEGGEAQVNEEIFAALEELLVILELEPGIAEAILDWIDPDDVPTGNGGAELGFYEDLTPPYRIRNASLGTIEELRMVRFVDPPSFQALAPFVSPYPRDARVNVNTAPAEVLRAMVPALDEALVDELIEYRFEQPFETPDQLRSYLAGFGVLEDASEVSRRFRTDSTHFTIQSAVTTLSETEDDDRPGRTKLLVAVASRTSDGDTDLLYWRAR